MFSTNFSETQTKHRIDSHFTSPSIPLGVEVYEGSIIGAEKGLEVISPFSNSATATGGKLAYFVHALLPCLIVVTKTQVAYGKLPILVVGDLSFDHSIGISGGNHYIIVGGIWLLWNFIFVDVMILDVTSIIVNVIVTMV